MIERCSRAIAVAAVLLVFALPLRAQVRGVVTDPVGRPLPGVLVELWAPEARAATAVTDASGDFRFTAEQARGAHGLSLTHLGYRTISRRVASGDTLLAFRMDLLPLALPELVVRVTGDACPNVEDPRARRLWSAARRRYVADTSERGISVRMLRVEEPLIPADRVGWIDESRLSPNSQRFVGATPTATYGRFIDINVSIAGYGYARRTGLDRPAWRYVALDYRHAHHFRSDVFGDRHTLSVHGEDGTNVVLAYCPRDRSQPVIEGTIVIGDDTTFVSATWRFVTPDGRSAAGGEVTFVPWTGDDHPPPHLLAARGVFWRRRQKDWYFQRSTVYKAWRVGESQEAPGYPPLRF